MNDKLSLVKGKKHITTWHTKIFEYLIDDEI
jgi:hypothetical protein